MATLADGERYFGPFCATGAVTGTGAAINIKLDFKPIRVDLWNIDDAGGGTDLYWSQGMPAASGRKVIDSGAGTTNLSYISADGITVGGNGFTIGADGDVNVSGESIAWTAFRSFR